MPGDVLTPLLSLVLLILAYKALFTSDLLSSIISFVGAGLVAALIWARLRAPDIAIAEAAIGAGVTGALLLLTWQRLGRPSAPTARQQSAFVAVLTGIAFLAGLFVFSNWRPESAGLATLVARNLAAAGVDNPVTAVLLNYRSFDTLMEIAVLLVTLVGLRALNLKLPRAPELSHPALVPLVRLMVPVTLLLGGYVLWAGADMPGGAFQAGAIWTGALVLLYFTGALTTTNRLVTYTATLGLTVFTIAALVTYALTGVVLLYVGLAPGIWIFVIEIFAAISIAITLFLLFMPEQEAQARP